MATKNRKIRRKQEKRYRMVDFEVEGFEGTFSLPDLNQVPLGVQRKLRKGDMDSFADFIGKYGGQDVLEAFDDMDAAEIELMFNAWNDASEIDLPKSEA